MSGTTFAILSVAAWWFYYNTGSICWSVVGMGMGMVAIVWGALER